MKGSKWLRLTGALLTVLFTVYLLLDSFVIEKSYAAVPETKSAAVGQTAAVSAAAEKVGASALAFEESNTPTRSIALPDDAVLIGSGSAENTEIRLYTFRFDDTQVYAADVITGSALSLRTALAGNAYGRNLTDKTSSIAAEKDALLAINGDFYGSRDSGLVIRNGVLYRDGGSQGEDLVIYSDGSFEILPAGTKSGEELLAAGAWQAFSFGPGLVEDGAVSISAFEEVGRSMASNPRTAIGVIEPGHYLFLVSDGRTSESAGLSLARLAELMASLGCTQAYNLDGGGSSAMVFQGAVVNKPTTNGRKIAERSVSDIVYV